MSKQVQDLLQRTVLELNEALFQLKVFSSIEQFQRQGPRIQALVNDIQKALKEIKVTQKTQDSSRPLERISTSTRAFERIEDDEQFN